MNGEENEFKIESLRRVMPDADKMHFHEDAKLINVTEQNTYKLTWEQQQEKNRQLALLRAKRDKTSFL